MKDIKKETQTSAEEQQPRLLKPYTHGNIVLPKKQKVTEPTERQRYTAFYLKLLSQWNTKNINMDYKYTRSIKGSTYYSTVNMLM